MARRGHNSASLSRGATACSGGSVEARSQHSPRLETRTRIPFVPVLEVYRDLILPRLADGPKTLALLDVPLYAMQQLERAGLVKSKREMVTLTTWTAGGSSMDSPEDFPAPSTDCGVLDFDAPQR
jgi:hypothetical protein